MSSPSSPPRFQFSLRWLFVAVTCIAVLIGLGMLPFGQAIVGLLLAISLRGLLPTVAVASAIYGRGDLRAFAIGAVVVCIPLLTTELGSLSFLALVVATISQLIAMGLCGAVAVATRRWLMKQGLSDVK